MKGDPFMQIRTDLAVEAKDTVDRDQAKQSNEQGVIVKEESREDIKLTYVTIEKSAVERIGKKAGEYITLESLAIRKQDTEMQATLANVLSEEIVRLLDRAGLSKDAHCLVVGLGNRSVTPDALGPSVMEKVLVTNHLFNLHPETVSEGYRPVSALTPGVMGVTGIETSEIIHGVIKEAHPDFVIVVDALASRSIDRINATIQLSDTGIHPGSGVGNKRDEISEKTYHIPVLSIGVPTVVDAVTITNDTIEYILKHFGREWNEKDEPSNDLSFASNPFSDKKLTEEDMPDSEQRQAVLGILGQLGKAEKRQLIEEVLTPLGHNLMVTPKEVDEFIADMAHVIANGINNALHERIDYGDSPSFTR
ncbi:GPR endopeptidase [Thalassobacillus sp. CUG 92003]|uniref:GPR endopeptidase n=1 Tax=Thalassobacillus sp. CUG 92003 TaxID=2736641 RepID=UPI0015E6453C|nr:GPR endopeptidase [Thalassobacillus sp. CUG 92003]